MAGNMDKISEIPAFRRSEEINSIFDGVQNRIPNLEFSSDSDESNEQVVS